MTKDTYTPPQKYLERYADILINFALGGGKGIKKGDVVYLVVPEAARPLYMELYRAVLKAGGFPLSNYQPSATSDFSPNRDFFTLGSKEMVGFTPKHFFEGLVKEIDHVLRIDAVTNTEEIKGIDSSLVFKRVQAQRYLKDLYFAKELNKKLTWTIATYGTEAQAKEARLSLEEYWDQIIHACFLDSKDPIKEWQGVFNRIHHAVTALNNLSIESLHITGPDADLTVKIGKDRKWEGGRGANIPSFEVFTSPDWRGTEGWIRFNQPLYQYGLLIEGIELEFKKGKVVRFKAKKNEAALKKLLESKNADKIGEFSLTDRRTSRITKFMADTLYDENMGGPEGNTHIALGSAYRSCYRGKEKLKTESDWFKKGYNNSPIHSDIISTAPRTVEATLSSGKTVLIYKDGEFLV